jgi:GT2 family glycosyltransferase
MVAILSGGCMIHATQGLLGHALAKWTYDPTTPFKFMFLIEAGTSPQEYARNIIIEQMLATDCKALLMIDDDMVVSGTVLDLLATPEYDIVAPLQHMFMPPDPSKGRPFPEAYPCAFMFDKERKEGQQIRPVYPVSGCSASPVEAVGSGVMLIRREVLEDERMLIAPGMTPPAFFKNVYRDNGERIRGLDIDFCRRAHALGYKIKVNWSVSVGHYKRTDLNDVDLYAKGSWRVGYEQGLKSKES